MRMSACCARKCMCRCACWVCCVLTCCARSLDNAVSDQRNMFCACDCVYACCARGMYVSTNINFARAIWNKIDDTTSNITLQCVVCAIVLCLRVAQVYRVLCVLRTNINVCVLRAQFWTTKANRRCTAKGQSLHISGNKKQLHGIKYTVFGLCVWGPQKISGVSIPQTSLSPSLPSAACPPYQS